MAKFAYINEKRYEIYEIGGDWVQLTCDGADVAKLVSFEEARRYIYHYWVNLGYEMDYLTEDDFDDVQ